MNKLTTFLFGTTFTLAFTLLMMFTVINLFLGCESWNQAYWTEYNSCIYPSEFLGMFLPPYGG